MNSLLAVVLVLATSATFLPPVLAADEMTLKTTVAVLVGQPAVAGATPAVVAMPIGTVIVPSSGGAPAAERYMRARRELREAYRLGPIEQKSYNETSLLKDTEQTAAMATTAIAAKVTLLSFDDTSAMYRLRLEERGKEIAAPVVRVARGQWAIVGGRDGEEAPYFFVMLRPVTLAELAEESRWIGVTRPRPVDQVPPQYPEAARKARIEGVVVLDCRLDVQGRLHDLKVRDTVDPTLAEAAKQAVGQWRYEPARNAKGQPVEVAFSVTIAFWLT
ncbi:MAG TPA: energy transducer TonB [Thermoanaerobaculaceae bacterium]|nr:energy transducer TonB [Thermoanaerobaculaceae bacterium]HPS77007.1 energy transducer TonB [Thermoanaerobaculaceae bacterium]